MMWGFVLLIEYYVLSSKFLFWCESLNNAPSQKYYIRSISICYPQWNENAGESIIVFPREGTPLNCVIAIRLFFMHTLNGSVRQGHKKIYENTCTLLKSCPELIIKLFTYSFFKNVNRFRLECVCVCIQILFQSLTTNWKVGINVPTGLSKFLIATGVKRFISREYLGTAHWCLLLRGLAIQTE